MQKRQTLLEKLLALTATTFCDLEVAGQLHKKPQLAWIKRLHRKDVTAMEIDRHSVS
ncbi:hypothetical protein D3C87_1890250 [compost metagenome]